MINLTKHLKVTLLNIEYRFKTLTESIFLSVKFGNEKLHQAGRNKMKKKRFSLFCMSKMYVSKLHWDLNAFKGCVCNFDVGHMF